jgi:hypothetical protein
MTIIWIINLVFIPFDKFNYSTQLIMIARRKHDHFYRWIRISSGNYCMKISSKTGMCCA